MTTVRTLWHHRGPCSMKNLLRAALERPSIMSNISPVSPLGDHGHITMAFADRGLIDQQHPTGLFATMILDQSRPVTEQSHDQMPPYPVAAGHRTDRHHLKRLGPADGPAAG